MPLSRRALITGITGQAGSYLAEFLLSKGYEVHGLVRHVAIDDKERLSRIQHLLGKITLHPGSIESYERLLDVVDIIRPDECYHLAAQSFVKESFDDEFSTLFTNANGTHFILSAIAKRSPATRFYFAGSSEMFGKVREMPQTELTPFHPRSPYGISKVVGFELTRHYREAKGLYACTGILFNHESPRRGANFVTRKITDGAVRIKLGLQQNLELGAIDVRRDWGFAGDYVRAMWLMLQQNDPDDYVVATGVSHSMREWLDAAFSFVGLDWKNHVIVNSPQHIRPAEVTDLVGDATKARTRLGWQPLVGFPELVSIMMEADLKRLSK